MKASTTTTTNPQISMFAIKQIDGTYFGGFNPALQRAVSVDSIFEAKLFTNKFDIRLRPDDKIVEVKVAMTEENTTISESFRPRRRLGTQAMKQGHRVESSNE